MYSSWSIIILNWNVSRRQDASTRSIKIEIHVVSKQNDEKKTICHARDSIPDPLDNAARFCHRIVEYHLSSFFSYHKLRLSSCLTNILIENKFISGHIEKKLARQRWTVVWNLRQSGKIFACDKSREIYRHKYHIEYILLEADIR